MEIIVGETEQLTASEDVRWVSTNESVASINASGLVTANAPGVCEIKATADDKEDEITVTVIGSPDETGKEVDQVEPTSIEISPKTNNFSEPGVVRQLKVSIEPPNAITDVVWSSSDENIVLVDQTGWVNSARPGTATITAKSTVNDVEGTATINVADG